VESSRTSAIPFLDSRSRERVEALGDATLAVSSQPLGWPGLLVEAGTNPRWEVDDITVADHYLALNLDPTPLRFEVSGPRGFRPVVLHPGDIWVCPADEAFTHRVPSSNAFALVAIEPGYFARLLGALPDEPARVELRRAYGIRAPQLEHLVRALVAEADQGNPGGLPFVEALATAVSLQLAQHAGAGRATPTPTRGGLPPAARRRVLELMDARLERGVSVEELAREAGLSSAHFARAFKQAMGRAPHRHLLTLRLERARHLLDAPGARLSSVALRLGFADQSHFTRLFKREFGVTPGAVLRARQRPRATGGKDEIEES